MWRISYAIPTWILFLSMEATLWCLGWILIPVAAACGAYSTRMSDTRYHFTWRWMWLWDNDEDGIANDTYYKAPNLFLQIVYWSCLRNPVNNLRFVPYLSCKINPDKVYFKGSLVDWKTECLTDQATSAKVRKYDSKPAFPQWFFAWQGIYSNYYYQWADKNMQIWRFWIGWKIFPTDIFGGPLGYREKGAGFALQLKRVG